MSERKTNRALTVVGLMLSIAMAALEATVVSTAMPTVVGDLGGVHHYAWVVSAYLVTSSITVPLYGRLADLYGRKPILLFGIAMFLLGSIAGGASRSMPMLIASRAIQGLGAGAMQPVTLTIIGDIFDLEERSRMQGIFGAAWGFFGLVGPMLGGFIVSTIGWRWIFYINLPFGLLSMALVTSALHERVERRAIALDIAGAVILSVGITSILVAASRIRVSITIAAGAVALIAIALFVAQERRAKDPLLPLDLFKMPVIAINCLAGAIIGGAMIAIMTNVPLFVQGVMRGSPSEAGSAITPMVVTWPVAAALSGRLIKRIGFRPLIRAGLGITAIAAIGLALSGGRFGLNGLRAATAGFGVGMGLANTALLISAQISVRWDQRGVATASALFARTIGGALAVGVTGGVIAAALSADPSIPAEAVNRMLGSERGASLDPTLLDHVGAALRHGMDRVLVIIAALAAIAFLVSLRFPHVEARDAVSRRTP